MKRIREGGAFESGHRSRITHKESRRVYDALTSPNGHALNPAEWDAARTRTVAPHLAAAATELATRCALDADALVADVGYLAAYNTATYHQRKPDVRDRHLSLWLHIKPNASSFDMLHCGLRSMLDAYSDCRDPIHAVWRNYMRRVAANPAHLNAALAWQVLVEQRRISAGQHAAIMKFTNGWHLDTGGRYEVSPAILQHEFLETGEQRLRESYSVFAEIVCGMLLARQVQLVQSLDPLDVRRGELLPRSRSDLLIDGQDVVEVKLVKSDIAEHPASLNGAVRKGAEQLNATVEEYGREGPLGTRRRILALMGKISDADAAAIRTYFMQNEWVYAGLDVVIISLFIGPLPPYYANPLRALQNMAALQWVGGSLVYHPVVRLREFFARDRAE